MAWQLLLTKYETETSASTSITRSPSKSAPFQGPKTLSPVVGKRPEVRMAKMQIYLQTMKGKAGLLLRCVSLLQQALRNGLGILSTLCSLDIFYEIVTDETLIIAQSWVAWPLPPDLVPREGEHIGPEDEDDAYTFKRREVKRPSGMLEDVLLGVALKQAKERFEARKWAEEVEGTGEADVLKMDSAGPALKDGSHPPKSTNLVPVISADDERSRQLLRSSIRHTISNVDKLLMGLKHTMDTCRQYASYAEATSGDETEARASSRASSVGMFVLGVLSHHP